MNLPLSCVATLVARKGQAEIDANLLAALRAILSTGAEPRWLDPGQALDLPFEVSRESVPALRERVGALVQGHVVDAVLQPAANRRKKLFLADMDSTMIEQECIDELADFAGLKAHVAAITERAMRGEIAFEPALRERVALLKGLPVGVIDEVLARRITMTPGGATLVKTIRQHGTYCALVSGGFTLFTGPVAAQLGFDEHRSNILDVKEGRLAGTVAEPILGREAKRNRLLTLRNELGLAPSQTMAVGDGANDLAMLAEAGLGIAFRAKPAVAAAAHARIDHADLTALLFVQGFSRDEFVG